METIDVSLNAEAENWKLLRDKILNFSSLHQLNSRDEYNLLLICEEWFINIVSHGFPQTHTIKAENSKINIHIEVDSSYRIKIVFLDEGIPFNPFHKHVTESITASIEQQLGGLGLHFIINLLESYNYVYKDSFNHTVMYYYIEQKEQ